MIGKETRGEMVRFVVVGALATAIHYGIYLVLLGCMADGVAYTIGYVVSFVFNYLLSSRYTFRSRTSVKNGVGFCAAHGVNYLIHITLFHVWMWVGVPEWLVPIPVYAVAIPVNFLLVRLVFKRVKSEK
ncbi:MAG: GtrA family protein [Prevotella sp.]|nr:GtrA family protein [Prevotella sp.]